MDPFLIGSLASAGIGLVSQAMTNHSNEKRQNEANQLTRENLDWQKQQYFDQKSYNEALQNKLFEREDTSYRRTKDDLIAAGYSPLAINGTNDAGTVVGNPSVPELPNINPFQANSLNFGQMADILSQAQNRKIQERALDIQEEKNLSDTEQKELDREERKYESDTKLNQAQDQFNMLFEQNEKFFKDKNQNERDKIDLTKKQINNTADLIKLENTKYKAEALEKTLASVTGNKYYKCAYYPDSTPEEKAELQQRQEEWSNKFSEMLKDRTIFLKQQPQSESNNYSGQLSIIGSGVQGNYGDSKSWDITNLLSAQDLKWMTNNPYPMGESCRP